MGIIKAGTAAMAGLGVYGYFNRGKGKMATGKLGKDLGELEAKKRGFQISKNHRMKFSNTYRGIVFIGAAGTGKTAAIMANMLRNNLPRCSKIIFDPKGTIYNKTHRYRESLGEICMLYEPLGETGHYNLLAECSDFTQVRELASTIILNSTKGIKDETWVTMSTPLLTAALLYAKHKGEPYNTIFYALETLIATSENDLVELFKETNDAEIMEQYLIYSTAAKSDGTVGSIKSTIASSLQLYSDPKIRVSTAVSDFHAESLRERQINIYIKYDIDRAKYLSPLLAPFFNQMIFKLIRTYGENTLPVLILGDELQNIGKIPNLAEYCAYMREFKIGLVCCIQNTSKLYDTYGQYDAETILNSLQTKVIFGGLSDSRCLSYISQLTGQTEVLVQQEKVRQKVKKVLFDADEIRRIKSGKVLIVSQNQYCLLDDADYYFKDDDCLLNVLEG
jgi:type IV secretion system protein VirD4